MSDIRKDFMAWFKAQAETQEECPSLFEAYQAGRAHDIDGLIAEISRLKYPQNECEPASYKSLHNATADSCIDIIRKRFGKE